MSGLTESPDAIGALLDALETEGGEGTSDTPPETPEGPKPGEQPAEGGGNQDPPPEGTTAQKPPEGQARPEDKPTQSPIPKALEPFKPLLDAKKWDPTKPDWFVEPIKALQEAEQLNGRQSTDLGLTRSRVTEVVQALHGSPKEINDFRARAGLPALPFESTTLDDKIKAAESEMALLEQAMSPDEKVAGPATAKIVQNLRQRLDTLRLDKAVADRTAPRPGDDSDANASKKDNWNRLREQYPDATQKMSALVPFLATKYGTGLLGSFGMDPFSVVSTPERARQAYELASRLWLGDPENFKAEVDKAVKAKMEENRQRQVAGGIPGGAPAAQPHNNEQDGAEEHLAGMFMRGN